MDLFITLRKLTAFWFGAIGAATLWGNANASVLTFEGFGTDSNTVIPSAYGSRIAATTDPGTGYQYGLGNGFTPNITITYAPSSETYSLYNAGYGELNNALGHQQFDIPGEIIFTPDPGYQVKLNSFDIAGWFVDYQTQISIFDDNGTIAFPNLFSSNTLVSGTTSLSPISNALAASGALHIYVNNIGSTGLDNINFDQISQVSAVPLPAAIWLFGSALLAMLGFTARTKLGNFGSRRGQIRGGAAG